MFRALGSLIGAWHQERAMRAFLAQHRVPLVVWRKTSIPAVPRKAR